MFSRNVSIGTTILVGVSSALVAGSIVSIRHAHAAPRASNPPAVAVVAVQAPTPPVRPAEPLRTPLSDTTNRGADMAGAARIPIPATSRQEPQMRSRPGIVDDPFGPLGSRDVGEHCAAGLDAQDISDFFSQPIGAFQGADYQRTLRLADDRVLWTFQDAFINGTLVHNAAMIQSGRCFSLLNDGARSWLFTDETSHMHQWHWILGGGTSTDGAQIHLFVVQMNETGASYLSRTRPTALRRVVLDALTLRTIEVLEESIGSGDLYGWSVTSDAEHTYLYSHCYQQFGHDTMLGIAQCAVDVKLARVPLGRFDAEREYWDGSHWSAHSTAAIPVIDATFVGSGNNPAQISFDGTRFILVQKRDDWWGTTIDFGAAADPHGPFLHVESVDEPRNCEVSLCNTYFAAWIPWNDSSGQHIWSIGHNRWNGSETASHLADYRPTFHAIGSWDRSSAVVRPSGMR